MSNVYYTFVNCLDHLEIFSKTEVMPGKPGKLQVLVSFFLSTDTSKPHKRTTEVFSGIPSAKGGKLNKKIGKVG